MRIIISITIVIFFLSSCNTNVGNSDQGLVSPLRTWNEVEVLKKSTNAQKSTVYLNLYFQNTSDTAVYFQEPIVTIVAREDSGKRVAIDESVAREIMLYARERESKDFDSLDNFVRGGVSGRLAKLIIDSLYKDGKLLLSDTNKIYNAFHDLIFLPPKSIARVSKQISPLFDNPTPSGQYNLWPQNFGEDVGQSSIFAPKFYLPTSFNGYNFLDRNKIKYDTLYLRITN